jgi:hypothetical protein
MTIERPMFPPRPLAAPADAARDAVPKRRRSPAAPPPVDVDALPDLYCLGLEGDCLQPLIPDGASVAIRKSEPYKVGDIVCIWWQPDFIKPGMHQGWLKRVRLSAPPWVKKYPYKDHPESDVKAIIVLEQLNPPGTYAVPCEHILAIHKAVGFGPPATIGGTVRSDKMLPIGDGVVPEFRRRP